MTAEALDIIRKLSADEIADRLKAIADEDRMLRVLLRSVRARERAARERDVRAQSERQGVSHA